jgi:hypothetical protein
MEKNRSSCHPTSDFSGSTEVQHIAYTTSECAPLRSPVKKLFILLIVTLIASSSFAANFRVFFYLKDKHGVHGPRPNDPTHPYEGSMEAASESAARREILRVHPNAVQIEINRQPD